MSKKYDTAVFIGRFQPVHNAHYEIMKQALDIAERLIIIVGSADQPRTFKNPFKTKERFDMIMDLGLDPSRVILESNYDTIYNDNAWAARVQNIVNKYDHLGTKVCIIGHEKDESSFYLRMFPQWTFEEVSLNEPLNATDIRDLYFRYPANYHNFLKAVVPPSVLEFLLYFSGTDEFNNIVLERQFVQTYKKQFESLKYPPIFVTTDAIVTCLGNVLVVKRKSFPGKGLLALPGGFLNANSDKSVIDGMLRELKEETSIKIPVPVLKGSVVNNKVFDAINRSERGRTITHAFHIDLKNEKELPKIKAADDAEDAFWLPLGEMKPSQFFEDHYEIINYFTGV